MHRGTLRTGCSVRDSRMRAWETGGSLPFLLHGIGPVTSQISACFGRHDKPFVFILIPFADFPTPTTCKTMR